MEENKNFDDEMKAAELCLDGQFEQTPSSNSKIKKFKQSSRYSELVTSYIASRRMKFL